MTNRATTEYNLASVDAVFLPGLPVCWGFFYWRECVCSQKAEDNHLAEASHVPEDNQPPEASHVAQDNHEDQASQHGKDNQQVEASQYG